MTTVCGAKTRSGETCKNKAMENGRCRMHGGKSTGAPPEKLKGNKNAVTTGAYESIFLDALEDDELALWSTINTDVDHQIEQEIKLFEVRERRMLKRIQTLMQGPDLVVSGKTEQGGEKVVSAAVTTTHETARDLILRIEESLTRVQERKARLVELKYKLQSNMPDDDDHGNLSELTAAIRESAMLHFGDKSKN